MTSAAVVSRIKIKERMSYYAQRDGDIKVSSAALAMPSTILNKSYGLWAKNLFIFNATKCPKDAKGWSGFGGPDKLDYLCLKDLANSLGLETQEKLVSQEFGVTIPENSIVEGSFKGALPYAKASQKYFQSVKVLPPKDESDAYEYWKTAKPLADAEYVNIAANLFPRHAARVATNNGQRKKQKEDFDQFIVVAESENKRQVALCEKTTKVEPCKKDRATVLESGKYDLNGIINVAYVGLKTTTEPVSDKVYEETIKKLSDRLKKMEQHYLSTGLLFPVDQSKVNLAGGGLKGPAAKAPNMLSLGDKGEPTPLPKAGDPIAPKGAIAIPPTTTNPTFGMRAAPSMTSGNKAAAVAIATPPSTLGAKVDKNLGPNAGLNAGAAIAATTPQQPNRENVAMIAPMTPIAPMTQMMPMTPIGPIGAGSPLAPRTNTPNVPNAVAAAVAPFNEKLYRDNRGKEFLTQWLNRCKDNDCRRDVSALLTKQLDEEVAQIKADVNAWNNKVLQERIQDIVEKRYEVQLKTELVPSTSAATSSPTTPAGPVKALTPIQPPTQPSIPPRITRIPATVR